MAQLKIRGNTQIMSGTITNAEISESAAIASSKLADGANFLKKDGSVSLTGALNAGGFKITNAANGTDAGDLVTKSQLDSVAAGILVKEACRVATSAAITISSSLNSGDVIDGVTLSDGDRVLVKNQADAKENGVYVVGAVPARASDFDDAPDGIEVRGGNLVFVAGGTANANTSWVLTGHANVVVGTDNLVFTQYSGAGSQVAANVGTGAGVFKELSGNEFRFRRLLDSAEIDTTENSDDISFSLVNLSIASGKLADGSVITSKISDLNVTTGKLADSAVTTGKIADANVTADKLASDSVITAKILDANVTAAKLASDSVTTAKIVDANVTTAKIADANVTTAKIADANVTTGKLADSAVTTGKLGDGSVTTAKIVDANVTADKLASDSVITAKILDANVTAAKLASDSVTTAKILDANVTAAKLASDSVTTAKIVDANVTADKLASDSVTTVKIVDANVTAAKLASDSVTTAKIVDANVTTAKIADANVTTGKLADSAVTTAKIADANVTADKLASDSVTTVKIVDANVTTAKIADANVTTGKLADSAVTTAKIADANVTADKLASDSVTTAKIADSSITNAKIASDAAIARSKLASGTASHVIINDVNGVLSSEAQLSLSRGGSNANLSSASAYSFVHLNSSGNAFTSTLLTGSRAIVSDANGLPSASSVTSTEVGYLSGVTSAIQTQLDARVSESKFIFNETPSGTIDGSNAVFTLANSPISTKLQVMLNGLVLRPGSGADYTVTDGTITFESGAQPQSGDVLRATYVHD